MRYRHVNYNLEHGYIHNWLVAGPQRIPFDVDNFQGEDLRKQIAQYFFESRSGINQTPVERGPLTKGFFQVGDYKGSWDYQTCREDHQVDHSGSYPTPHYLRSWAYTQLTCKMDQEVLLVLTTHGPADVWLNWEHVHRQEHFFDQHPGSTSFKVFLKKGVNKILVRFEAVALLQCPNVMALQVCEAVSPGQPYPAYSGIHVTIPTLIADISRRNDIERAYQAAFILQDVFQGESQINLHWTEDMEKASPAVVRLQTPTGRIYAEATVDGTPGDQVFLSLPYQIPEGPYRILMMPLIGEYYEQDLRITHEFNLWNLGRKRYSAFPYGSYEERRQEALVNASNEKGLFAEIAKMVLDQWKAIDTDIIFSTLKTLHGLDLLGILGMVCRFGNHKQFPKELLKPIEGIILGFPFGIDTGWTADPGDRESDQILLHASEVLAGQLYPVRTFTHLGKMGQWHREHGVGLILDWLHRCSTQGFSAWDSNVSFESYLAILAHLVDLAEDESIREMSAILMDKLFTTIAINSFQGVFGSTHGRTYASFVKGGYLEPTSGITRLMWGTGIFNHHIAGTVSLACMNGYELPSVISGIANSRPEELWNRERHALEDELFVNKVTYKTPDTMLCSAQDYKPGKNGKLEHIWQATLGADATVFVTHPASTSEKDARQANFWAGNSTLPRVAQWKDILIAFYQLPEDDWMGFTHAYFPIYAFDEYVFQGNWAFARKAEGYLALTAARGFDLIRRGQYAYRELRSFGQDNVWLCHMGRKALDVDFSIFQDKVLALPIAFEDGFVRCTTLRNETLTFGWDKPFMRDGQEEPLSGYEHYESIFAASRFPCKQMEIGYGEDALRLNFEPISNRDLKDQAERI